MIIQDRMKVISQRQIAHNNFEMVLSGKLVGEISSRASLSISEWPTHLSHCYDVQFQSRPLIKRLAK